MLYTLSFIGVVLLALLLIYTYRNTIIDHLPEFARTRLTGLKHYAPLSTFENASQAGFSTGNFDLAPNLESDDRSGLDERTLRAIRRVMDEKRCGFDEARLIWQQREFRARGIDEFGFPLDPKAVTRL